MSNKIIIAAAGSGKTTHLVEEALRLQDARILITSYTEENEREIHNKFIEKNRCVPANVKIQTWFSFLLQHGVRPYQSYLFDDKIIGLYLYNGISAIGTRENDIKRHYLTNDNKIYSDKISKFVCKCDDKSKGAVVKRISDIYTILVGDPRQGTFSTNNSPKYKKYQKYNILSFFNSIKEEYHLDIDSTSLNKNYRCVPEICDFSNKLYPDLTATTSGNTDKVEHRGVFLIRSVDVDEYLKIYNPIQLRYNIKSSTNENYPTLNFGNSKGLSFERVLIYPTKTICDWLIKNKELALTSKCKFYVALTRARYSVAIVYDYDQNLNIEGVIKYK